MYVGVSLRSLRAVADGVVVAHPALGTRAAHAAARVHALVVVAGPVGRAVAAQHALGVAVLKGVAVVLGEAGANGVAVIVLSALGVGAAGRRIARVLRLDRLHVGATEGERIAVEALQAGADHAVVEVRAAGVLAAGILAGVLAFVLGVALLVVVAVAVVEALMPAVGRTSDEAGEALADLLVVDDFTLGVGAAGVGRAQLLGRRRLGDDEAALVRIAGVAGIAGADSLVLDHLA